MRVVGTSRRRQRLLWELVKTSPPPSRVPLHTPWECLRRPPTSSSSTLHLERKNGERMSDPSPPTLLDKSTSNAPFLRHPSHPDPTTAPSWSRPTHLLRTRRQFRHEANTGLLPRHTDLPTSRLPLLHLRTIDPLPLPTILSIHLLMVPTRTFKAFLPNREHQTPATVDNRPSEDLTRTSRASRTLPAGRTIRLSGLPRLASLGRFLTSRIRLRRTLAAPTGRPLLRLSTLPHPSLDIPPRNNRNGLSILPALYITSNSLSNPPPLLSDLHRTPPPPPLTSPYPSPSPTPSQLPPSGTLIPSLRRRPLPTGRPTLDLTCPPPLPVPNPPSPRPHPPPPNPNPLPSNPNRNPPSSTSVPPIPTPHTTRLPPSPPRAPPRPRKTNAVAPPQLQGAVRASSSSSRRRPLVRAGLLRRRLGWTRWMRF